MNTSSEELKVHEPPEFKPEILILISGKRKSGKDHFTNLLVDAFGKDQTAILRIAAPIKYYWSVKNNLDYERMLDTSEYKEKHRFQMVAWSQEIRKVNYGYLNVEAIKMAEAVGKPIWICSDIRHNRDYNWFREFYEGRTKRIRVTASDEVRKSRGWQWVDGIDDGPSECGLDHVDDWDLVVRNNGAETDAVLPEQVQTVLAWHKQLVQGTS